MSDGRQRGRDFIPLVTAEESRGEVLPWSPRDCGSDACRHAVRPLRGVRVCSGKCTCDECPECGADLGGRVARHYAWCPAGRPVNYPPLQAPADMASEALISEAFRRPMGLARSAALWAEIRHRLDEWQAIYRGEQSGPTRSDAQ